MKRFVQVESDGAIETHANTALGEYATLCGLDGDDEAAGQRLIGDGPKGKINCRDCIAIIRAAKEYHLTRDLVQDLQKAQSEVPK